MRHEAQKYREDECQGRDAFVARCLSLLLALALLFASAPAYAVRIKDVTHIEGLRDNMLIGYGIVVGLNGTGDSKQTKFTQQSLAAYLGRSGLTIDATQITIANVAAVVVTATLPAFADTGTRIDVEVSAIGDAKSLQGGMLLMTPLNGPDGQVYAVAQGAIATGGFDAGSGGSSVSKNHPTVGKSPGGALVEQRPPTVLAGRDKLVFTLDNPDFTTAQRISEIVNEQFKTPCAQTMNNSAVSIDVPAEWRGKLADFLAEIERLPVHPDQRARVVIDEKTGTVVMGEDVRIATLAIAHGNLSIQVAKTNDVSQPNPLAQGSTAPVSNTNVAVQEENRSLGVVPEGVSLGEVVQSLNAIGVTPRDLISILQSIKASGALQAELVIQ